jgi:Acetyltransferase (GNAT) domain
VNGYLSPLYAASLAEFGSPLHLAESDGWLLLRPISESTECDAIGCYPLFNCRNWPALGAELDDLAEPAVSVSLVVDPFAAIDPTRLRDWFPDVCRPFKEHAVVDFSREWRQSICPHHRRNLRAAARRVEVECCQDPVAWLETWTDLYANLIARHEIRGTARFSRACFSQQFAVPGMTVFRAVVGTETVGMLLWYVAERAAYYHLGAFSPLGYASRAAFALFDVALGELAARDVQLCTLGAGAGWQAAKEDGLSRFKNGWANDRRTAWFCGRILAPDKYERLTAARQLPQAEYFPKYRQREAA